MGDKSVPIPAVLAPLHGDYLRINRILDALTHETEFATRADFAEELVKTCAATEDAKEQALYPVLVELGRIAVAARMRVSAHHVREAMVPIFRAVRHSVPIDVHTADPIRFECDLEHFLVPLERHLVAEREDLFPEVLRLSANEKQRIAKALHAARRRALEHPLPPHNPLAWWLTRIEEHVDHIADTSEQYRPGRKRLAS